LNRLWKNPKKAAQQIEHAQISLQMLRSGDMLPSEKAADAIIGIMGRNCGF
jgi:hypothetical protein